MLRNNQSIAPFMGDSKALSVGLNPLGYRTASEQIFTTILPGLNVVSQRIRYYSFYCWILKRYYEKNEEAKLSTYKRHIRMSEYLLALIHAQSRNMEAIPGITWALSEVAKHKDIYSLKDGAEPNGVLMGGYWKNPYGAFGSYYAASLRELGLIQPLLKNPQMSNYTLKGNDYISGEELAEVFEQSIGEVGKSIFEQCIADGMVTTDQLITLDAYFQTHYLRDTPERQLLTKLILQKDHPMTERHKALRKDTIRMLLLYIQDEKPESFTELDFARFVYSQFKEGKETGVAATGWFSYYLNDSRQFEALNVFIQVLNKLKKSNSPGGWEIISDFSAKQGALVAEAFGAKNMLLTDLLNQWDDVIMPDGNMAKPFYRIFDDYVKNRDYKRIKESLRQLYIGVVNDSMSAFDYLERYLQQPVSAFVAAFISDQIIYTHYAESMRKYSQNGVATQKLTIEQGQVRWLGDFIATHSAPRVGTLMNFAKDLGLVKGTSLTTIGINLLNELQNDRA